MTTEAKKLFLKLMQLPEIQTEVKTQFIHAFEKASDMIVSQVFTALDEAAVLLPADERDALRRALARLQPAEISKRMAN